MCVFCVSLRQRGYRGRQCGREGERSLPAHYRQSTDAFRAVPQARAACLKTHKTHVPSKTPTHRTQQDGMLAPGTCGLEDALYSKMPNTQAYTATRSDYQQWCQVDNKVPHVLKKPTSEDIELHCS